MLPRILRNSSVREVLISIVIVASLLGGLYVYSGEWPPLVVVESGSMQHDTTTSHIGVIDTGDLILVQAVRSQTDIVTYIEGRATDYTTYGDYGDVIVFKVSALETTPIIHRAIMYIVPNGDKADVTDLSILPKQTWNALDRAGNPTNNVTDLSRVTIYDMGFKHDLDISFDLTYFVKAFNRSGYITMGDHNAYLQTISYDTKWLPAQADIIGRSRGEIPWFGLLKLFITPSDNCCHGWKDPAAPENSWNMLVISLFVFLSAYVLSPYIKTLVRKKKPNDEDNAPAEDDQSEL